MIDDKGKMTADVLFTCESRVCPNFEMVLRKPYLTLFMGGKMKLFTYQPLMVLLFILSLSGLSGDASACEVEDVCNGANEDKEMKVEKSDEMILSLPDDVDEMIGKALRFTLKVDLDAPEWQHSYRIDFYATGYTSAALITSITELSSGGGVDGAYYELAVRIPEDHIESWSAMKRDTKRDTVNAWLTVTFFGINPTPEPLPVSLVGASFVDGNAPVKREGVTMEDNEFIVALPDDELTGKSLRLIFEKTVNPIRVATIKIYAAGSLVKTTGPYNRGGDYETIVVPISEELLESWSAMKLREVTVWPEFYYHSTVPIGADPPLLNASIVHTSAAAVDDDDVVWQDCAGPWTTSKNCVGGDLDNDGDPDFFAIVDGYIRYFETLNTGEVVEHNGQDGPMELELRIRERDKAVMKLEDINGDGDLDLIVDIIGDGLTPYYIYNMGTSESPLFLGWGLSRF